MTATRRQNYSTNTCAHCGAVYQTARSHSKYCRAACRKAAWRERRLHNDSKKRQQLPKIEVVGQGGNVFIKPQAVDLYRLIRALGKSD